ncbi:hypothetical protein ACFOLC_15785 [Lysobacter cavernae]|uniref:Secreted protein n=1 Tax=Lysobacter cavernae TaxID=1685901 RepID=A0ABV7RSI7_9GAMM
MRSILAFVYSLLAMVGFMDGPGTTVVARTTVDGVDQLFSRTEVAPGKAHFQCLRSASGRCHYALFASQCTLSGSTTGSAGATCSTRPLDTFDLAIGQTRDLSSLPADFRQCVSHRAGAMAPDCTPLAQR